MKYVIPMYAVVGLQTSGLGSRRKPEDFSEAPGQSCLIWYRLACTQSILVMAGSLCYLSCCLISFYITVFYLVVSELLCPIYPCVAVLEPVQSATLWFSCPERNQNWWMQSTPRTKPGSLRRSGTLKCQHIRLKHLLFFLFLDKCLSCRTHWEGLLLKKSHLSITANTSKPFFWWRAKL